MRGSRRTANVSLRSRAVHSTFYIWNEEPPLNEFKLPTFVLRTPCFIMVRLHLAKCPLHHAVRLLKWKLYNVACIALKTWEPSAHKLRDPMNIRFYMFSASLRRLVNELCFALRAEFVSFCASSQSLLLLCARKDSSACGDILTSRTK